MKKSHGVFFRILFFGIIPALLLVSYKEDFLIKLFSPNSENEDLKKIQLLCFIFGTIIATIVNPITNEFVKYRIKRREEKYKDLLLYSKDINLKILKSEIGKKRDFKIRLFLPLKGFSNFKNWFRSRVVLKIRHVEGLTDEFNSTDLSFAVTKEVQEGMVGKSYHEKNIFIDFDLTDQIKYTLTAKQRILVGDVKFCATIPIFMKESEKVKAVLSIDCNRTINLNRLQKIKLGNQLKELASFVSKQL